jgi:hypothetical protein
MSSSLGSSGCGPRLSSASTRIGCGAAFQDAQVGVEAQPGQGQDLGAGFHFDQLGEFDQLGSEHNCFANVI